MPDGKQIVPVIPRGGSSAAARCHAFAGLTDFRAHHRHA